MQTFFFIAFPYIALILAIGVGLYRYFSHRFTYSSLSSQLLENRHLTRILLSELAIATKALCSVA